MDKILNIAKRLKTFTLDDIVMFTGLDIEIVKEFLESSASTKNDWVHVDAMQTSNNKLEIFSS